MNAEKPRHELLLDIVGWAMLGSILAVVYGVLWGGLALCAYIGVVHLWPLGIAACPICLVLGLMLSALFWEAL